MYSTGEHRLNGQPTRAWGKLEKSSDGTVVAWHPLADHCADVAACTEALLHQTVLAKRLARLANTRQLSPIQIARLGVLSALHDMGKANRGFQNKADHAPKVTAGHLREVLTLFTGEYPESQELGDALDIAVLDRWGETEDATQNLLIASICHHGKPLGLEHRHEPSFWQTDTVINPFGEIRALAEQTKRWFPSAYAATSETLPAVCAFQHAFSGLVMLADWLASDSRFFEYSKDDNGDRMCSARQISSKVLLALGLNPMRARNALGTTAVGFERISPYSPRAAQVAVMALPIPQAGSLSILEAETGAGKTEAALAHFIKLFQAGEVDGMYFALPTRTAATQIHTRVVEAIARAFPDPEERPPVVLAVPGYLAVDDATGRSLPGFEVLWNDDDQERMRYRGWAAENAKRYLAGAIVVGTIDQVLLSTLAVGHAHLRATALLRHLLVVDEVHASDPYMNRLLEKVLSRQLAAGGHAFLMSATLGSAARERLLSVDAGIKSSVAKLSRDAADKYPYPVLTSWRGAAAPQIDYIQGEGNPKSVRITCAAIALEPSLVAKQALDAAVAGAKVLVIRNTVRACLDTQQALERLAGELNQSHLLFYCNGKVAVHHSRFTRDDRQALDNAIESALGKGAPLGGRVVVATQTVQQSLDLDADILFTDVCPMDVLLQRIGRAHRHAGKSRPSGFEAPAPIIVLTPPERDLGTYLRSGGEAVGDNGIGTVYEDLRILEATWQAIEDNPLIAVPADCRRLVEATTHPDTLRTLAEVKGDRWVLHQQKISGEDAMQKRLADLNLANWNASFGSGDVAFPSGDLARKIPTRLGEDDRIIAFDTPLPGPFGTRIKTLTMSAALIPRGLTDPAPHSVTQNAEGFSFELGSRRFRYDRLGLRPDTSSQEDDNLGP